MVRVSPQNMTPQAIALLSHMLHDPQGSWFAFGLAKSAKVRGSTAYDTLARWERAGWIEHVWEDIDPAEEGRPRRKLYRFSADGAERAQAALHEHDRTLAEARGGFLPSPTHPPGLIA